jgi:hypothetical protein
MGSWRGFGFNPQCPGGRGWTKHKKGRVSAAFFATGHNGGVEALAEVGGKVIDLVGTINFDCLAGGVEGDLAVAAAAEMLLQFGAGLDGYRVVDEVVEESEEFRAGHFSSLVSPSFNSFDFDALSFVSRGAFFMRK